MQLQDYLGYTTLDYLLQVSAESRIKRRSYELMQIESGHAVLDVGCGPGIDTITLAQHVGSSGLVAGLDHDPEMIAAANAWAQRAGIADVVTHYQGDASALPFPTATFNACRSERVFQHLADPAPVLAEMVRVTQPNGHIVLIDTDWTTFSIDTPETDIEQRVLRFVLQHVLRNGYAGRQLYRLGKQHQLVGVTVEAHTQLMTSYAQARLSLQLDKVEQAALAAGIISAAEFQRWNAWIEQVDRDGMFFCSVSQIIVAGRRPY